MVGFEPLSSASEPCCPTHCAKGIQWNFWQMSVKSYKYFLEILEIFVLAALPRQFI